MLWLTTALKKRAATEDTMRLVIKFPILAGVLLCLTACAPDPSQLVVTYGPWEPLHRGTVPNGPMAPVSRVLEIGRGPKVEAGMMIEAKVVTTFGEKQINVSRRDKVRDLGRHWIYVAFDDNGLPEYPPMELKTADDAAAAVFRAGGIFEASFIGIPLGQKFTFGPREDQKEYRGLVGYVDNVPFGSSRYVDEKPIARYEGGQVYAKTPELDNETSLEIVRLCKGRAAQRLVTLQDSTEISIAQDIGRSHTTSELRWMYLREARWTGMCNDGKAMHFDYGPVRVSPPAGKTEGLRVSELFGPWVQQAWRKIDVGVTLGP